ncbi:MAG: response regulator [Thermodesulfobacteriota bacterium]
METGGTEKIRVLVVDDERDFAAPLVRRLKLRGLETLSASSGAQALDMLAERPMDVVILDVRMPGMDGIQAIKEIKARHPLLEVIMLTGHADLEASLQGMEQGAFDYLLKPADIDDLVYKVQDAFRKKELQQKKIAALKKVRQEQG